MNKLAIVTFVLGFGGCYILLSNTQTSDNESTEISSTASSNISASNKEVSRLNKKIQTLQSQLALANSKSRKVSNLAVNTPTINTIKPVVTATTSLSAEEIETRLGEIKNLVITLKEGKDGKPLVALIKELGGFGPAAYKQIAEISSILDLDRWRGRRFSGTYNKHEYEKAIPKEIYAWALQPENFKDVGGTFRMHAYTALPYTDRDDIDSLLVSAFVKEDNRWGNRHLAGTLRDRPDEKTAQALIDELNSNLEISKDKRYAMNDVIFAMPGEVVDAYIDEQIENATDDSTRSYLTYEKLARNPANSGFLVSEVHKNTQAAKWGLKMGDTIVKYGEFSLADTSIDQAKRGTKSDQPIMITVIRDGEELVFEAKPGQIGIDGDRVTKD